MYLYRHFQVALGVHRGSDSVSSCIAAASHCRCILGPSGSFCIDKDSMIVRRCVLAGRLMLAGLLARRTGNKFTGVQQYKGMTSDDSS